jgi:L-amino acid N-acyltransferase YncA
MQACILRIYAHHVLNGTGSFEERSPDINEIQSRHAAVVERGLPISWQRCRRGSAGLLTRHRFGIVPPTGFTVEDSVYIDADDIGLDIGPATVDGFD